MLSHRDLEVYWVAPHIHFFGEYNPLHWNSPFGVQHHLLFITTLGSSFSFYGWANCSSDLPKVMHVGNKQTWLLKVKGKHRGGNKSDMKRWLTCFSDLGRGPGWGWGRRKERSESFKENLGFFFHILSLTANLGPLEGKGVPCVSLSVREVRPRKCVFGDSRTWF